MVQWHAADDHHAEQGSFPSSVPFSLLFSFLYALFLTLLILNSWVQSSGGQLGDEEEGVVEVSPLVSYCGEAVEAVVEEGVVFTEAYDLTLQGYGGKGKPGASFKTNVGFWMLPVAVAYIAVGALKILGKSK